MPSKLGFYGTFLVQRALDVQGAGRADVVVIQRDLFPFGPPLLERRLLARNPHLVYDVDDATYLRPSFTPNTVFQRLRRFDKVAEIVRDARWVSAATEPIASWARALNPHVQVVPMAIDPATYRVVRRGRANDNVPVVLGWAGTAGGIRYLEALGPVLRQLAQQHPILVRVVSGGYRSVCLPGVPLDARPWRPESQLVDIASFDIGLVPLDDTPFERAKFPSKLLQYMALGVPTVSSQVGTVTDIVRHGANGLLASSPAQWLEQLGATDPRCAAAAAARRRRRRNGGVALYDRAGWAAASSGAASAAQPRPAARY